MDDKPATPADMTRQAREILVANDRGGYTVPTADLYPFQWNWDSAFVALGWATFDSDRAWQEIEKLFDAQWPSGMVPHIIFWTEASTYFPGAGVWQAGGNMAGAPDGLPFSSGISQPPVVASIVKGLAVDDPARAAKLIEPLNRWHKWWHSARDAYDLGVIAITHPWESGRDNLPDWDLGMAKVDTSRVGPYQRRDTELVDPSMRPHKEEYDRYLALVQFGAENGWDDDIIGHKNPFLMADPSITAVLLAAERDLASLMKDNDIDSSEVDVRIERLASNYDRFWNSEVGAYCAFDVRSGTHAGTATSASFLAPYAGVTDRLDTVVAMLEAWSQAAPYLVPSFDPRGERFEANRYWCGPVWAVVNYMIATGLAEQGAPEWAERIRISTRDLIITGGFAESFNPVAGSGTGGHTFSWTAAMWLAWAHAE